MHLPYNKKPLKLFQTSFPAPASLQLVVSLLMGKVLYEADKTIAHTSALLKISEIKSNYTLRHTAFFPRSRQFATGGGYE